MPREHIVCVNDADEALAYVSKTISEGDAVLVKASHYMGLDRVVEGSSNNAELAVFRIPVVSGVSWASSSPRL